MYLRRCRPGKTNQQKAYWQLVESYRSERGPRQRVVAYLGDVEEDLRQGIKDVAEGKPDNVQTQLFTPTLQPAYVEIVPDEIYVERVRDFGGYWLGLQVLEKLGINSFWGKTIGRGREEITWDMLAATLVLMRLCNPSSELRIAEELFEQSALAQVLQWSRLSRG